jgi:hypothetical protein
MIFELLFEAMDPFLNTLDFFCSHIRNFVTLILQSPNPSASHWQESDRALRDGSLGWRFPGTSCQATIALSLRGKSNSPVVKALIKLALMGF